jgi:SWIM zinc finger
MAKSFSTRYVDYLLGQVRAIKPAAADYIENIDDLWRSTDWMSYERQIPPRYGIVTSNTSECVNNMFAEARTLGWLECVDKLVDIMSNRIFQCRTKHMDKVSLAIVPKVAERLQARWEAAASLTVMELQAGCGDFKVVEISSVQEQDYEGDDRIGVIPLSPGSQAINIVKPGRQWCTCGLWQEFLYPCRHGCAVYRKWEEKDLNYVLENVVHVFYRYDCVQKLFQHNVFPTCIDNATYDGETKPPRVTGRQAGRPRTKRIRRRSEFLDPEKSPITCSECGKKGHNKRTCQG